MKQSPTDEIAAEKKTGRLVAPRSFESPEITSKPQLVPRMTCSETFSHEKNANQNFEPRFVALFICKCASE
jgi:hypothetical protein